MYLLFRKNTYEVHFLKKAARKRRAVLLKLRSFMGLVGTIQVKTYIVLTENISFFQL